MKAPIKNTSNQPPRETPSTPLNEAALEAAFIVWREKALESIKRGHILSADEEGRIVIQAYLADLPTPDHKSSLVKKAVADAIFKATFPSSKEVPADEDYTNWAFWEDSGHLYHSEVMKAIEPFLKHESSLSAAAKVDDDMVERVARALAERNDPYQRAGLLREGAFIIQPWHYEDAKAAIAALTTPNQRKE